MAMICVSGGKLCNGCMNCYEDGYEERQLRCPVCGRRLAYEALVYVDNGTDDIIGCEHYVKSVYAEDVENRL